MTELDQETIATLIANKKDLPGGLLPILHDIQDALGYIPKPAIDLIAQGLNQTAAEIYGVISFYHHFRTEQPGQHVIEICRAEACQSVGSEALENYVQQSLATNYHQTSKDNKISLEPVYCLGNCACGPSVKVDERVYGRMNAEKFEQLLRQLDTQVIEVGEGESL